MTTNDALGLLIGRRLGQGEHRDVYECFLMPDCVVKVERGENRFANPMEWTIWQEYKGTRWAKWLAPCRFISACGLVLIMEKCQPLERRPAKVPAFMADLKRANWGTLNGRPVCLDYGNNAIFELVKQNAAMVAPRWHDLTEPAKKSRR